MGIYNIEMFSCSCDIWSNRDTGVIAYTDEASLKDEIGNDEWYEHDGKWHCPDCYEIDDEDEFKVDLYKSRMQKVMKLLNEKQ